MAAPCPACPRQGTTSRAGDAKGGGGGLSGGRKTIRTDLCTMH